MIIGISGKKGSGKNTVADIIKYKIKKKHIRLVSFAEPIKEILSLLLNVPLETLEDRNFKKTRLSAEFDNKTPRELMKIIGTFMRTTVNEDFWINQIMKQIYDNSDTLYVITDVRYKNEMNAILKRGGEIIRVERTNNNTDTHQSETDLDDVSFEYTIHNNGTIEQLIPKVVRMVNYILDVHNE